MKDRYFGSRTHSNEFNIKIIEHEEKRTEREKNAEIKFNEDFKDIDFDKMKARMKF